MATMKMSGCLALVAKMPEADQDALLARVDQYQADGIPAERAQVMAANDVLAEIRAERSQLMSAIAEQHPDLLTVTQLTMSRERQIQTPEFKRWFGDSKVVDENGEPLVVYHGTADDVSVFGLSRNGALGGGIYFTDASFAAGKFADRSAIERPNGSAGRNVIPVFLKAERLLDLDAIKPEQIAALQEAIPRTAREAETLSGEEFDRGALEETQRNLDRVFDGLSRGYFEPRVLANALGYEDAATFIKVMRRAGFDGIAKTNNNFATEESYREFTVFRPEQVKSATGNNGAFDPANPDITASRSRQIQTPEFKRWFGDSKVVDENGEPLVVYHGSVVRPDTDKVKGMGDIRAFDRMFTTKFRAHSLDTVGSWFSTNPGDGGAKMYSGAHAGSVIYPVYLSIKNPQVTTFQLMQRRARLLQNGKDDGRQIGQPEVDAYRKWLKEMGKDGIKIEGSGNDGSTEFDNQVAWIALEPEQIKSATGNNGQFDPANPDITASRSRQTDTPAPRVTSPRQRQEVERNADAIAAMGADTRDNTELGDFPGGPDAYNLYEARTLLKKPSDKLKRVTERNTFSLWQNYDYLANVDGELFGVTKQEDPDEVDDETKFIYSFENLANGTSRETVTDQTDELFAEMRASMGGDAMMSRQRIVGESKRAYTPEQLQYFENVGRTVTTPTLKERIAELRKDLGKKMAQGIADQFRPISDLGQKAYALARLSRGSSGAFEALLHHGKLSLKDGVYDADQSGGFIERVGVPLQGELEDFLWWVAANRAERLTAEDRERLFTAQDIAAGKSLDQGTADFDYVLQHGPRGGQTTRDRTLIFRDALKTFDEFNKNTLDMAEQSGLIDGASRKIWEHEFYVPFYRIAEEGNDGFSGAAIKNSLVRQEAFKKLKGGKEKLNSDLLANTLANWGHLIDAASKNRAAKETLVAAANLGAAVEADEATIKSMAAAAGKKNQRTWFMDGGVKRHFLIEDQAVVTALTSLDYAGLRGPLWDALTAPKHWLTIGVTASPHFKIKNLIRDSVQAIATSELSYNPVKNIAEGVRASDRNSQTYVSALASGGLIRFGTMLEGSTSKRTRQLIKMGVKDATILDSDNKVQAMYDKFLEPMVMAYNEIGNRGEEINRASLFKQLTDNGMDQAQAALMARDLMDFSMQGSWTWVRVLTQVVPFLNARIQGMYKLGRSAVDDPKRFGIVLGAVAAASVSLLLAYEDDDDWKKREDWDRDTYWWFKVGGTAFRIPKPFEIGAIGTLAERGLEYFMSPEMTNKRFRKVVSGLILDQLSMNPVPQVFKPLLDLYSNKDSFTGRPIETMGMEKVKPQYRFTDRTSILARGLSTGTFGALSPVQYDHLVRGYFAWLGSMVVTATDAVLRPVTGQGERATPDYWKLATGGLVSDTSSASSRYVSQMYEQAKELEQAMGTYRMLMKTGRLEEGREFFKDNKQDIVKSAAVDRVKAAESRYNEMIRMIERSKLDPDVKRDRIQAVQVQKDKIARLVAPGYAR